MCFAKLLPMSLANRSKYFFSEYSIHSITWMKQNEKVILYKRVYTETSFS